MLQQIFNEQLDIGVFWDWLQQFGVNHQFAGNHCRHCPFGQYLTAITGIDNSKLMLTGSLLKVNYLSNEQILYSMPGWVKGFVDLVTIQSNQFGCVTVSECEQFLEIVNLFYGELQKSPKLDEKFYAEFLKYAIIEVNWLKILFYSKVWSSLDILEQRKCFQ